MSNQLVPYEEELRRLQEEYRKQERPSSSGNFLSTQSGVLSFQDQALPGNQVAVIILDSLIEHTYYPGRFDSENPAAPVCYAFGRDTDTMEPHWESMVQDKSYFNPQSMDCRSCPMNEWGSSPMGRGKACKQTRRLTMLPAGVFYHEPGQRDWSCDLFDNVEHFQAADVAHIKVSVTSVKNWTSHVQQVSQKYQLPPVGVVTKLYLEPDPKTQFQMRFETLDKVPNHLLPTILERRSAAVSEPIQGYSAPRRD